MFQSDRQGTAYPTIVPSPQHPLGQPPPYSAIMRHAKCNELRLSADSCTKALRLAINEKTRTTRNDSARSEFRPERGQCDVFPDIDIMLALRSAMIQHEPAITRKTISRPKARARILFV